MQTDGTLVVHAPSLSLPLSCPLCRSLLRRLVWIVNALQGCASQCKREGSHRCKSEVRARGSGGRGTLCSLLARSNRVAENASALDRPRRVLLDAVQSAAEREIRVLPSRTRRCQRAAGALRIRQVRRSAAAAEVASTRDVADTITGHDLTKLWRAIALALLLFLQRALLRQKARVGWLQLRRPHGQRGGSERGRRTWKGWPRWPMSASMKRQRMYLRSSLRPPGRVGHAYLRAGLAARPDTR